MDGFFRALAVSLSLTVLLEAGFALAIQRSRRNLPLVLLVNVLTNPAVMLLYWLAAAYTSWNLILAQIPLEAAAVLTEGFYYRRYGRGMKRPFLFSCALNAFSFGAGALLQLTGWL